MKKSQEVLDKMLSDLYNEACPVDGWIPTIMTPHLVDYIVYPTSNNTLLDYIVFKARQNYWLPISLSLLSPIFLVDTPFS